MLRRKIKQRRETEGFGSGRAVDGVRVRAVSDRKLKAIKRLKEYRLLRFIQYLI